MLRFTFSDRTYFLKPFDDATAPLRADPDDVTIWVPVYSANGLTIEALDGGEKEPIPVEMATTAVEVVRLKK